MLVAVMTIAAGAAGRPLRLADLDNRVVDPFDAPAGVKAIVFVFTSIDCPVSNRYAPEIRRISDTFAATGVRFWMVYPNPAESAEAIRTHVTDFAYPGGVLRDPQQDLVRLAGQRGPLGRGDRATRHSSGGRAGRGAAAGRTRSTRSEPSAQWLRAWCETRGLLSGPDHSGGV